jgi:KipI family sensor histidine kinase inhibitor
LNFKGITNITPSYNKLIISYDLSIVNFQNLKEKIKNLNLKETKDNEAKIIKIPICLDDEFSLDLNRLSEKLEIKKDKIIQSFLNKEYFCYMTGFIAGMPFLGNIDSKIRLQRLETPRVKVPKGSVGITEQFCNIYTFESPGGWNIIGNTPIKVFDKFNEKNPAAINPGDKVTFYKINKDEYLKFNE